MNVGDTVKVQLNGKVVKGILVKKNARTYVVRVAFDYKRRRSLGTELFLDKSGTPRFTHKGYVMQRFTGFKEIVRHFRKHNVRGL